MNLENANIIIDIFSNADIFMLIFTRMLGFLVIMPIIGGNKLFMVKIGLAIALASIIVTNGYDSGIFYYDTIFGYALLIAKEFIVGYMIGYISYFIFNSLLLTGQLTDQQMGYSMANVFDPVNQMQVSITGNLYYYTFLALFFVLGGHHFVIKCLFYSYNALPIGALNIIGNKSLFTFMIRLITKFFVLGFSVAIPIVGVILVMEVALGVLSKAIPKMNMLVIGMPLKVFAGIGSMWIIVPLFGRFYYILNNIISEYTLEIIGVIMP